MSPTSDSGRRRFEALRVLYAEHTDVCARVHTAADTAAALGYSEDDAESVLRDLVARLLLRRDDQTGGYSITSAGIRIMERTLFHRPHIIA